MRALMPTLTNSMQLTTRTGASKRALEDRLREFNSARAEMEASVLQMRWKCVGVQLDLLVSSFPQ